MPRNKTGHFYFEWYPTIFQADTQSLTLAEDGAYRRLIDHYMLTRSPLPDDDRALSRIIGIGLDEWENVKQKVKTYFKPSTNPVGYLHHGFCDETLETHKSRIEKSRNNGKKGGRPKSLPLKDNNPPGYESETQQKPITEQNRTERKKVDDVVLNAHEKSPFQKVYDFGCDIFPNLASKNTSSITKWIASGYDPDLDINPTLKRFEGKNISSWAYFDQVVVDAHHHRISPLPKPKQQKESHNGQPAESKFITEGKRLAAKYRAQSAGQSETN